MLTGWLISFYGLLDFVAETKGPETRQREHRFLREKEERSESKIGTRVGTSLLLLLQNEWKDMHHWGSPWHHHARCRHRRIPAKHASTSTKPSTGVCCCCKKGRQQRKKQITRVESLEEGISPQTERTLFNENPPQKQVCQRTNFRGYHDVTDKTGRRASAQRFVDEKSERGSSSSSGMDEKI